MKTAAHGFVIQRSYVDRRATLATLATLATFNSEIRQWKQPFFLQLQQKLAPAHRIVYQGQIRNENIFATEMDLFGSKGTPAVFPPWIFCLFCLCDVSQQVGPGESQAACSYIKYQVHRVHMQSSFFAHCRSKTQLGYHRVPSSEALYQSQYLVSCINGCCAEPSNSTGRWSQEWRPNRKGSSEHFSHEKRKKTHAFDWFTC